jgi:hypothetical protein
VICIPYIEKHGKWVLDRTEWGNDTPLLIANIFFNVNKKLLVQTLASDNA